MAALHSLGREGYISLIVDFRDGVFPWGKRYFAVNDLAVRGTSVPMLIAPGTDDAHCAELATQLAQDAVNASICSVSRGDPEELLVEIRRFIAGNA